jgi:periplasmic protein TonB
MQKYYTKLFLLTLFFITGTTLFSCTNTGNKKQNNEIEVVDAEKDEINKSEQIPDTSHLSKEDNPEHPEKNIELNNEEVISLSKKANQVKSVKPEENITNPEKDKKSSTSKKEALTTPEVPLNKNAEFPGGIDQFHSFFMKEYKKPEGVSYWKLNLNLAFAVEKNGTISFLECSPAIEEPLEKEIIRVLSLCPKWQPGEFNGKKIRMQYSVPILLK